MKGRALEAHLEPTIVKVGSRGASLKLAPFIWWSIPVIKLKIGDEKSVFWGLGERVKVQSG